MCKNCKRKVLNENISDEDESNKTSFNAKNNYLHVSFVGLQKTLVVFFCVCYVCVVTLSATETSQRKKEQ